MTYTDPAAYERFMGRWSARLAPVFIRFVSVVDGQRILDVGCGTGNLSRTLLMLGETTNVVGVDPAAAFVRHARQAIRHSRAQFQVGTAEALPYADDTFDAALGLLLLQEFPDPSRVVLEMARVTRCGGQVATCQWDFRDGMPMLSLFWQAAEAVAPEAVARHWAGRPRSPSDAGAGPSELGELWTSCGLSEVRTTSLVLSMKFCSFDDFWLPFLGGATPTTAFARALDRERRGALARALRDRMPEAQLDGSFVLPARAWAVAGIASGSTPPED